jgi:hypothetical protein
MDAKDVKPGEYVVKTTGRIEGPTIEVEVLTGGGCFIYADTLLRPAEPAMTPEERAVIETADRLPVGGDTRWWAKAYADLIVARDALRASRQPPDPVKDLREAWNFLSREHVRADSAAWARVDAAIAALEKEGK